MSNKPWQWQRADYWADNTIGILKHENKTYFIYFHKTPHASI